MSKEEIDGVQGAIKELAAAVLTFTHYSCTIPVNDKGSPFDSKQEAINSTFDSYRQKGGLN